MPACFICGTDLAAGARSCPVCGSLTPDLKAPAADPAGIRVAPPATAGKRLCPACRRHFDSDYADSFCICGTALVPDLELELEQAPPPPALLEAPDTEDRAEVAIALPAGVARLIVYSAELQPIHTLPLDRDVTRIGRDDPVRGDFVDLDVGRLFDAATARKVSRKHALILRSRETGTYLLRPLARNTGTQVGNELARDLVDYPLADGTRIVLGGVVRLKFHLRASE
jgi:hypothetical protein